MKDKYWVLREGRIWSDQHAARLGQCGRVVQQEIDLVLEFSDKVKTSYLEEDSRITLQFEEGECLTFHYESLGTLREMNLDQLEI